MTTAPPENDPSKLTLKHIESKDDLRSFACGVHEIDKWAKDKAYKFHYRDRARVTVANSSEGGTCGFYSLTHSVAETSKLLRREDRDIWSNAPILYIGYIAVHKTRQRCGIGRFMLIDALKSAHSVHRTAPLYGVGLRSLNDDATRLYESMGFQKAPKEEEERCPLMILPIWTVEDLFKPR